MGLYEILLRYDDRDEVRLTDSPLEVGSSVEIAGTARLVQSERARRGRRRARYICVELREDSRELRARSSDLIGRSRELPDRLEAEPE
jgi:hypothetical protein